MAKNLFTNPYILFSVVDDEEGNEDYNVSGQDGKDPFCVSFGTWLAAAISDPRKDTVEPKGLDEADYVAWWVKCMNDQVRGYTAENFASLNPGWDYDKYPLH